MLYFDISGCRECSNTGEPNEDPGEHVEGFFVEDVDEGRNVVEQSVNRL